MSKPRAFRAGIPVHVIARYRARIFSLHCFRKYFRKQLARNARKCRVEVYGYFMASNHVHLLVAQLDDGHDPLRVKGIAALMRNIGMALARAVNRGLRRGHGTPSRRFGHFRVETYRSFNLETVDDALRVLTYCHGQIERHGLPFKRDRYDGSSWGAYRRNEPDGAMTHLVQVAGATTAELIERAINTAVSRGANPGSWREAHAIVLRDLGLPHPPPISIRCCHQHFGLAQQDAVEGLEAANLRGVALREAVANVNSEGVSLEVRLAEPAPR